MIHRLDRVKDFGCFHDFSWPVDLVPFKQFNLIFGWNYSGKTTFTRALRCFELKKHHDDFGGAEVQFCDTGGTVHHLSTIVDPHLFRVFNVDYVRENILFDTSSAPAILILGAEDIAKQAELVQKQTDRETLNQDLVTNRRDKRTGRETLEAALTAKARDIKNDLKNPNYDRTKFEPKVEDRKTDFANFLLTDNEIQQNIDIYRSTDKKEALSKVSSDSLTSFSALKSTVTSLLARVVTANSPIARLTADPEVERWVNEGRPLHDDKTDCQFCGRALPVDLLATLEAHFSADYTDLMNKLETQLTALDNAYKEIIKLDHKSVFYTEQGMKFEGERGKLELLLQSRQTQLGELRNAVAEKQLKAFSVVSCPEVMDNTAEILKTIQQINLIIDAHNERSSDFDANRAAAFSILEKHYAATFAQENSYRETLEEIDGLGTVIDRLVGRVEPLNQEITRLQRELSDAVKGAETINEFLRSYFGKDDLLITAVDNRFQITRNNVAAKNLSEGERTAVAFAYFMTRVLDGNNPLAITTVVIDDPIGSLDANHLFNTYAFIKTKLKDCLQLFILTHNFEFYSLIRDWALEDDKPRKARPITEWLHWSIYLMRRADDGKSVLEVIPDELLKFNSEYHYLFATLLKFEQDTNQAFDYLMSLPNIARRFLEAFGGVMIPIHGGLHAKMSRLFNDRIERERVAKFINNYSHNTSIIRALIVPDVSECKAVVAACLNCVRNWDAEYFLDLETSIQ
jgi:wobble nucleotide-excising tRNase